MEQPTVGPGEPDTCLSGTETSENRANNRTEGVKLDKG